VQDAGGNTRELVEPGSYVLTGDELGNNTTNGDPIDIEAEVFTVNGTTGNGDPVKVYTYGFAGDDEIHDATTPTGNELDDVIFGGSGNDSIYSRNGGDDIIYADAGADKIYWEAKTATTTVYVDGGDGNDLIEEVVATAQSGAGIGDTLFGGAGDDTIRAGTGEDTITGGLGADELTGGSGADTFVYNTVDTSTAAAMDTITDYESGSDILSFDTTGDGATTDDAALAGDAADEFLNGMATGALATNIAADGSLADALAEFLAAASFDNNDVAGFVYGGDTYVVHADADGEAGNIVMLDNVVLVSLAENTTLDTFTGAIA